MKTMTKTIIAVAAAMAAMVGYAGDSAPFRLDTMEGTRVARETETIAYSTEWDNGGKVAVAVDGVTLKEAAAPASGDVTWNARNAGVGNHTLTHTTYKNGIADKAVAVTFIVKPIVTFNTNGGALGTASSTRAVDEGTAIGTLPTPTRTGYTFAGWWTSASGGTQISASTTVTGNVTYYAHWTVNQYTVTFDSNGGIGGWSRSMDYGAPIVAPTVTRRGYAFAGWSPTVPKTVPAGNVTYVAQWTQLPAPEPEEALVLFEAVAGAAPGLAASVYDGYLYHKTTGALAGTIQVKVGKPNAKTGLASVKATVIGTDGKKTMLKAGGGKAAVSAAGPTTMTLVGGETCKVTLGAEGLSGSYGSYLIDGARNFFLSKDKGEQNAANALLAEWLGPVNVVWGGGTASVAIGKKGRAKASVTLADGKTKVSANATFLIGEEWCCVPVVAPKADLAFTVWLRANGGARLYQVEGLGSGVVVGKPGTLKSGAKFHVDAAEFAAAWRQAALPYLPDGVAVGQSGAKWVLPKAGKVAYGKDRTVDATKLLGNPSGLKLTYKAADGSFKGSFKAYSVVNGKPKGTMVNVAGVMVDGVGHGTATVKGRDGVAVTIK